MDRSKLIVWLLLAAPLFLGCDGEAEAPATKSEATEQKPEAKTDESQETKPTRQKPASSPDEAVQRLITDLADGKGESLWDALPPQYRADVNAIVRGLGGKVDPEVWKQSLGTWLRVVSVVDPKNELIAGSGALAKAPITGDQFKSLTPHAARILKMLLNSELRDAEQLKAFDGREFCRGTASVLLLEMKNALREFADVSLGQFVKDAVAIHATQVKDETALVEIMIRGSQFPPIKLPMSHIDGHWIPTELAVAWPEAMAKIRAQLDAMPPITDESRNQQLESIAAVGKVLDDFESAETDDDFNQALAGLSPFLFGSAPASGGPTETPGAEPVPTGTVNVVVTSKLTNAQIDELIETWEALTGAPDSSEVDVFERNGQTVFVIEPVGDVTKFAEKIDFVDELDLDPKNRSIRITLPDVK